MKALTLQLTRGVSLTVQSLHVESVETSCRNRRQEIELSKMLDSSQSGENVRIELCRRKNLLFRSLSSRPVLDLLNFARIGCVTSLPVLPLASFAIDDAPGDLSRSNCGARHVVIRLWVVGLSPRRASFLGAPFKPQQ